MFGKNLRDLVATVAPTVATAMGGPLAGVATRVIAGKLLGSEDATVDEVAQAIERASPADLIKLKEVEFEFRQQMRDADIQLERVAADDRNSARQRQTSMRDWTPSVLGLAIILGFFGTLAYVFRFGLPDHGSDVLLIMMGALGTMTGQVGNFFFGSSVGSKDKSAIIAELKGNAR